MDWGLQAQFGVGGGGHSKTGQFGLLINSGWEFQVGDTVNANRRLGDRKQVAWLEVSREKSLNREQGLFAAAPHLSSLLCPPTAVRFLPGRHLPHDARHGASSDS